MTTAIDGERLVEAVKKRDILYISTVYVYCDQTVGWIRIPLGTEVGLGPGDVVLDGDSALQRNRAQQPPHFSAHVYCDQTIAHLSNC